MSDDRVEIAEAMATTLERAGDNLPPLFIDNGNLPAVAKELATRLAAEPDLFDRRGPARLVKDSVTGGLIVQPLNRHMVLNLAHEHCQPIMVKATKQGAQRQRVTLPLPIADLYLARGGDNELRPLDGITSAPLLSADGTILTATGYQAESRMCCEAVPALAIPERPTEAEARAALGRMRFRLRSFCFADAATRPEAGYGAPVVDLAQPPGLDESSALVAVMTAVCRASLDLAPGLVVRGAALTGAGAGKGLLVRVVCAIAFGRPPSATTAGHSAEELDKRVSTALASAESVLFLDNVNSATLASPVLASALTESPAKVRLLGASAEVRLNARAFVAITGNALTLGEDLARRFLVVELDAKTEDPEARRFPGDLLFEVAADRAALLADVLTIWRWGVQRGDALPQGQPLGSFGRWARWCRDPLLALGCRDPVERLAALKAADPHRRAMLEIYTAWQKAHGDRAVAASELDDSVTQLIDPRLSRQALAAKVAQMVGTRIGGWTLVAIDPAGRWSAKLYRLVRGAVSVATATPPTREEMIDALL